MSPADIRHKEFAGKMMGYDKEQVKAFLGDVATSLENLQKQNADMEEQLQEAQESINHFHNLQDALNKSLIVAQDAADRLKDNAYQDSKEILLEAEEKANQILQEAAAKASQVRRDADLIRDAARTFRVDLHDLLDKQLDLVESEEWDRLVGEDAITSRTEIFNEEAKMESEEGLTAAEEELAATVEISHETE